MQQIVAANDFPLGSDKKVKVYPALRQSVADSFGVSTLIAIGRTPWRSS
jgi:hypothetical protein